MKLNLTAVLNIIAVENESAAILNDPDADWNINPEKELENDYAYYKMRVEMENDYTIDLIEHCEKYGWDYFNIFCEKVLSYEEWLAEEMKVREKYLVAA